MADLTAIFGPEGFKVTTPVKVHTDPVADFAAELQRQGYDVPGAIQVTGDAPVRMTRKGSKEKPGWYFFQIFNTSDGGEIGFGAFGDWRDASTTTWSSRDSHINEVERSQLNAAREAQAQAAKAARNKLHAETAQQAANFVSECRTPISHPYLVTKQVKNHGLLEHNGSLVMPLVNADGDIRSYQTIDAEGGKRFLKDAQKAGTFHLIGTVGDRAYICEGYATAASVYEATGIATFVALDTGNLARVVKAARQLYPAARFTIAADNDESQAGRIAAEKACKLDQHTSYILPPMLGDFNDYAVAGGNISQLLNPVSEVKPARSIPFSQLRKIQPEWIIKGVLPVNTLGVIFGPSGGGKSFLALDLAFHIALGEDWCGHKTKRQGGVYYICGEGDSGIWQRVDAWQTYHRRNLPLDDIHKTTSAVPISDPVELQRVIDDINSKGNIQVVEIDTLNRNFGAGDENSTEDMSAFVAACDRIRVECGVTVLVIHHTGLNASDRARGSSVLKAATDTEIMLTPNAAGDGFIAAGTKQKDGAKLTGIEFKLQPVVLGIDEDGDDFTSCVIVMDGTVDSAMAERMKGMGKNQITVWQAAQKLNATMLSNVPGVTPQFTHEQLFRSMEGADRPRSDKFKDATEALCDRGLINFSAGFYTLGGQS